MAWCQSEDRNPVPSISLSIIDTTREKISEDYEPFADRNGNNLWDPDEPFTDRNGNNIYDDAENYQDINKNGMWDNQEPFTDKGNGVFDIGEKFVDIPNL